MEKLISGSIHQITQNPGEWAMSMAKAMEDAFLQEWPIAMDDQPVPEVNNQMRLLFVAIAKGVVKHLGEHKAAFDVDVNSGGNPAHTHTTTMNITTQIDP